MKLKYLKEIHNQIYRLTLLLGVVFLSISILFLIQNPPVSQYEISIYSGLSHFFWIFFIVSLICFLIAIPLYSLRTSPKKFLYLSLLGIGIVFFIFFFLPVIRGYALFGRGGADILSHVGHSRTILQSGHIGQNWYPVSHILLALFNMIGLTFEVGRAILSLFFTALYIVFSYLYLTEFSNGSKKEYLPVVFCTIPLVYLTFHVTFHPAIMSFLSIPVFLYLIEKRKNRKENYLFNLMLFLVALSMIFFHPMSTVLLIVILFVMFFSHSIYQKLTRKKIRKPNFLLPILILFMFFFIWYSRFASFSRSLNKVFSALFGGGVTTVADQYGGAVGRVGLTTPQLFIRFIELYGPVWIYAGIGFLFIGGIFKKFFSTRKISLQEFILTNQYLMGIIVGLAFILLYLIEFDPLRVSRYVILMSTLMIGFNFSNMIKEMKNHDSGKKKSKKYQVIIIVILILITLVISLFNVYAPNNHLTYSEKEGTNWYIENADLDKRSRSLGMDRKMIFYLNGRNITEKEARAFQPASDQYQLPKHLGYTENESVGESFDEGIYIITKEYDYNYYESYYPHQWEHLDFYTKEDLEKLESDHTSNKLYCNGGYIVWQVNE